MNYPDVIGDMNGGRSTIGLPFMQKVDIEAMAHEMETRRPTKVLEYGAGASSLYWTQRYADFIEVWIAVEHQLGWAMKIGGKGIPSLSVILVFENDWHTYTQPPNSFAPFDMIIVDGVFRGRCIWESHKYLAPNGVVFLHDADRPEMEQFESVYPHFKHLTRGNSPDGNGYMKRDGLLMMWGGDE